MQNVGMAGLPRGAPHLSLSRDVHWGPQKLGKESQNHVTQTFLLLTPKRHRVDLKKFFQEMGVRDNSQGFKSLVT